ncbi:MAG: hypothetical protein GVY08_01140 [Bacteroidetes bacterium]|jgi:hypothetical protein|nr:hypothetical protein [Bacteroidota bacterium]
MTLKKSDEWIDSVKNIVHQDTQQQEFCLDLTVSEIRNFTGPGSLDFGGSEFAPASTELIEPKKKNPEDTYGWWKLLGGIYRAVCNESFKSLGDHAVFIVPHQHALDAGLMVHAALAERNVSSDPIELLIHAPGAGCNIKENARIASAYRMSG